MLPTSFTLRELGDGLSFLSGALPPELLWSATQFEEAWALHPEVKPTIHLHGRLVMIPRWQQAYGEHLTAPSPRMISFG